jgi:hypothetical protein
MVARRCPNRMRAKTDFLKQIMVIWVVQPRENILLPFFRNM